MSTSKLLGAVCAGALLLTAGCAPNTQTVHFSAGGEAVTTAERFPLAVLDERVGPVLAVTFAFDRDTLDQNAQALLNAQVAWMAERPELQFSVTGHADKVGNPDYNLDLGQRRAKRVLEYLVAAGIERDRLEALVSQGEDDPLIETENPERLNRRVTIEVAGLVKEVATLDEGPWWRRHPRPYRPNLSDGSKDRQVFWSSSDTVPSGTSTTSNESTSAPIVQDGETPQTIVTVSSRTVESTSQSSNPPGTKVSTPSGSGSESKNTPSTPVDTPTNPKNDTTPGKSGSAPGPSTPSQASSDRMDAGRGNGPDGGDPGKSYDRNQGGDED